MTDRRFVKTTRNLSEGAGRDGRIYGKLGSVSLNDILQLLGMAHRTATVRLESQGQQGRIYFRDGVLLHATAGSTEGERALLKLVNWQNADFVVEEGVEGNPPATIAKNVDAVMLALATRLDEGWVPEMTPFPLLDRPTTSATVLDARPKPRTPPRPKSRRRRRPTRAVLTAAAAAVLAAAAAALALIYPRTDLAGLPPVSFPVPKAISPGASGVAAEILQSSIDGGRRDAALVLAAHGLSLSDPVAGAASDRNDEPPLEDRETASAPEAPPDSRTPDTGHLLVLVEPWAEVAVDGVDRGQTPLPEMILPAGSHALVLSNPNFVGLIRDRVQVPAGQSVERRYSFNESGTLRLLVRPWADVYVDGRHAGQTPMAALRLPPGTHTIVMRHPELGEKSAVVEIFRDRESVLEVEM